MESLAVSRNKSAARETVFDRLYKSHTVSSKLKSRDHETTPMPSILASKTGRHQAANKNVSKQSLHSSARAVTPSPPRFKKSARIRPWEQHVRTSLRCSKKYHSEMFEDLSPRDLKLVIPLAEYEASRMTREQVAGRIIQALFTQDFPHATGGGPLSTSKRWEIAPTTVKAVDETLFAVEKNATWDWEANYSVSQATATIRFVPERDEILVEDYSFFRCWLKHNGKECKRMYYGYQKKSNGGDDLVLPPKVQMMPALPALRAKRVPETPPALAPLSAPAQEPVEELDEDALLDDILG